MAPAPLTSLLTVAALLVLASVVAGLLRLRRGPGEADRLMAAQLVGTGGIAIALLLGRAYGLPEAVDLALTLALLAAFVAAALARAS